MSKPEVYGIEMGEDVPEGWTPFEAIAVLKCIDPEGKTRLALRVSDGWSIWEAMGALDGFATSLNEDFQGTLGSSEDDGDAPA